MKTLVTCGAGLIRSVVIRHIIPSKSDSVVNTEKLAFAVSLETPIDVSQKPCNVLEAIYSLVECARQSFFLGFQFSLIGCRCVDLSKAAGVLQRYSLLAYIMFFVMFASGLFFSLLCEIFRRKKLLLIVRVYNRFDERICVFY